MYSTYANPNTFYDINSSSSVTSTLGPTDEPVAVPEYLGYIACGVAVLFFGSNFIPVKQFKTGDGKTEEGA